VGRDTAAAIGLFAAFLEWKEPGATFAAMPADQHIADVGAFQASLKKAYELAQEGALVTFGVKPSRPATGFGYLEVNGDRVVKFWEKPDATRAADFVARGHLWNSGIFVWKAAAILAEIRRLLPDHAKGLDRIQAAFGTSSFPRVIAEEYPKIPKISIDYGVMEKAKDVRVVRADFAWDDVGSWTAAAAHRAKDADGNVVEALSARVETKDCIVLSTDDRHLVATLGVSGLVVVHTKDATLVCPKDRAEELKKLVDDIAKRGLEQYL
jgi:mannose-1-phosphate guanylyltransferase